MHPRSSRKYFYSLSVLLLSFVSMMASSGCASRPYPENKGGEGSGAFVAMILPFVIANEIALYAIEKDKERDKDKAAAVVLEEKLSRKSRFDECQRLASSGDAAMRHELAFCYLHGRGATRDIVKAIFWLRKSARQGFAEAQNELGLCYYNEIGVKYDKTEACAWWSLAAPAHEQAKASLDYVVADTEKRLTKEAFSEFIETVRRRAAEIKIQ